MAPNFSKLVSKFWTLVSKQIYIYICTNSSKIITISPDICTNSPKICANFPKMLTDFPKRFWKNIVTRFLNHFRIYGSPPSPGFTMILRFDTQKLAMPKMRSKAPNDQNNVSRRFSKMCISLLPLRSHEAGPGGRMHYQNRFFFLFRRILPLPPKGGFGNHKPQVK